MFAVSSFVLLFFLTIEGRVQKFSENNSDVDNYVYSCHINYLLFICLLKPIIKCKVGWKVVCRDIGKNYSYRGKLPNVSLYTEPFSS